MPLSDLQVIESVNGIFEPTVTLSPHALDQASAGYINLILYFLEKNAPYYKEFAKIDFDRLERAFKRFHRDAFGVRSYLAGLDQLEEKKSISVEAKEAIKGLSDHLSIRIKSDKPRKTRVVAAFSLWFTTLRPFYFDNPPRHATTPVSAIEPLITYWIVWTYLRQYGTINLGQGKDGETRRRRLYYDFCYRNLTLSSLEFMYSGIFRPHNNTG